MRRSTVVLTVSALAILGFFALAPALPLYPMLVEKYGAKPIDLLTVALGLLGLVTLIGGVALRKFERLPRNVALYETAEFVIMGTLGLIWVNTINNMESTSEKAAVSAVFFILYVVIIEILRKKLDPDRYRRTWRMIVMLKNGGEKL
ncbi:hypothetical protein CL1_0404 [Thermococcus cleftensis]|uniref:Uncharacterized protein n=1 Tax=Thermococcus cleftensis (strain DSM 27260 / KACC 17922 / CL1) TaxID=163003 RepID=I3ZSD1_THECF|nr:hypothetical protein [Thermococcus cleftensis]AFL94615.1 hypothetical protein CL1_0404 [Thermococcus cleftensis]